MAFQRPHDVGEALVLGVEGGGVEGVGGSDGDPAGTSGEKTSGVRRPSGDEGDPGVPNFFRRPRLGSAASRSSPRTNCDNM